MRACFLGQNICALGYGVAIVQTPPLNDSEDEKSAERPPYPVVIPDDGQEHGRPAYYPLVRAWKVDPRRI
jgi:hypothetical protein